MGRVKRFLPWLVPSLLWLWLFYHLHAEWSLNPQYNYGWAVPLLAAFLFYLRWGDRPAVAPETAKVNLSAQVSQWLLLAALLPIHIVEEANPDWRALGWVLGLVVVIYSLLALHRAGGRAWARHF